MPLDIYDYCKRIKRRSCRDESDFTKWELAELARDLFLADPDREEMRAITVCLLGIERRIGNHQIAFSWKIQQAIDANDFIVRLPFARPAPIPTIAEGWLYIATAWSRPGVARLAASYIDPAVRLNRYAERYGYPIAAVWQRRVQQPYCILATLEPTIAAVRSTDVRYEDARDWYRITPDELSTLVDRRLSIGQRAYRDDGQSTAN